MKELIIEAKDLVHHYGTRLAVDHLSFDAVRGEVLGLLGPNGAGKTTTVRLLNGLFPPSSGSIRVLGMDPVSHGNDIRRQTGVLTETPALYERLTARQNLEFFGVLSGMPKSSRVKRSQELLEFFDLTDRAGDRAGTYSKGMKQRLALARSLLNNPAILFLDEPTSGLDPEAAQQVHELIDGLRKQNGQTVLLATHNLLEAERLCDRLVIMNHGRLLAFGSLDELRRQVSPGIRLNVRLLEPMPATKLNAQLSTQPGVQSIETGSDLDFRIKLSAQDVIPDIVARLVANGARILAVEPQHISLEEIYFTLQAQERQVL